MDLKMKIMEIQQELKAPKNQYNSFGGYKYRSCEDILEALKPLLKKHGLLLTLNDELVVRGDRYYIEATATINGESGENISNKAYAREDENKKGMDGSQITGTASSYARKYALNGLFLIDDTKDADTDEYKKQTTNTKQANERKASEKQIEIIKKLEIDLVAMMEYYKIEKLEDLTVKQASEIIRKKSKGY